MKLAVIVHPNSKNLPAGRQGRIEKDLLGTLHVYVSQPPLEGKANQAAIAALAEYFKTNKSSVKLISGAKSKYKVFMIQ